MKRSYTYLKGLLTLALAALTGGLWAAGESISIGVNNGYEGPAYSGDTLYGWTGVQVAGDNWNNYNNESSLSELKRNDGVVVSGASFEVTAKGGSWKHYGPSELGGGTRDYYDGQWKFALKGIPFSQYSVVLFMATDNGGKKWGAVKVTAGTDEKFYTYTDGALSAEGTADSTWGDTGLANNYTATEGVNVMVIPNLSGNTTFVTYGTSGNAATRGGLYAIQIINTGDLIDSTTYEASSAATSVKFSELTWDKEFKPTAVDSAVLTLTATEAVTLEIDQNLALANLVVNAAGDVTITSSGKLSLSTLDCRNVKGKLTIPATIASATGLVTATTEGASTYVTGETTASDAPFPYSGNRHFETIKFTVQQMGSGIENYTIAANEQMLFTYTNVRYMENLILDGGLLKTQGSGQAWFGGAENKCLTVKSGIADLTSVTTDNGSSAVLIGYSGNGHTLDIQGGLLDASNTSIVGWEQNSKYSQSGGLVKTKGFRQNGERITEMTLTGGTIELGAGGIPDLGMASATLGAATIRATADATIAEALNVTGAATLQAVAGKTLTVSGAISGEGTIAIGGTATTKTRADDGTYSDATVNATGTVYIGTNRPKIASIAEGATLQIALTDAELENGISWTVGENLTAEEASRLTVVGAELDNITVTNGTLTATLASSLAASWENGVWSKTPVNDAPITITFSEGYTTCTFTNTEAIKLASLTIKGETAGEIVLGEYAVTVSEMTVEPAEVTIPVALFNSFDAQAYTVESGKTLKLKGDADVSKTMTVSGTLALAGDMNFSGNNVVYNGGTLDVLSGVSTFNTNGGGNGFQNGSTIKIASSATLKSGVSDAPGYGSVTFDIAGTLEATDTARWSLGNTASITLREGAVLNGNGGAGGYNYAYDCFGGATITVLGNATINGNIGAHNGGTITFNIADGKTVTLKGKYDGGVYGGAPKLAVIGSGTLVLANENTYTGGTSIANGSKLVVTHASALGSGGITLDGALTFKDVEATLENAITQTDPENTANPTGQIVIDNSTVTLNAPNGNYKGSITVNTGATLKSVSINYAPFGNGASIVNNGAIVVENSGDCAIAAAMSGAGSLTVTSGNLYLFGANTYNGATTIAEGAKVIAQTESGATWNFNNVSTEADVTVNGTLDLVKTAEMYRGFAGTGTINIKGNVTLGNTGNRGELTGLSRFTGNLVVDAEKTLTLITWGNPYNIALASLELNGAIAGQAKGGNASTLSLTTQALVGEGTINIPLTLADGATLAGPVTVTGDVTVAGALTITHATQAGDTVITCANAEAVAAALTGAPEGLRYVAENGAVVLAVATITVTLPPAPDGTYWYYNGAEVTGSIEGVDPTTGLTLTLKTEEGYVFANGSTSKEVTVAAGETSATLPADSTPAAGVAKIGDTYYLTIEAAAAAVAEDEVIVLEADVTTTAEYVVIPAGATLDLNGCTSTGTILGTIDVNGGTYVTAEGIAVIGTDATTFESADAVFTMDAVTGNISIDAGTIEVLDQDGYGNNWTLPGQTLTIKAGVELIVPEGITIQVNGSTVIVEEGAVLSIAGAINLYSADATIEAADGLTITTSVADSIVKYVDGAYTVVADPSIGKAAKIGETYYDTFLGENGALAKAQAGDTITLLADVTVDGVSNRVVIDKAITLDGNGKTITATNTSVDCRAINIKCDGTVKIQNLTVVAAGERAINVITYPAVLTMDKVTLTAANYAVNVAGSAGAAKVTITNSTLNGLNIVNVGAVGAQVLVEDTTLNLNDTKTELSNGFATLSLNKDATNASIAANRCTFNITSDDVSPSVKAKNGGAVGGTITIDGSSDEVGNAVALVLTPGSNYYLGCATLEEAIQAAKTGDTIKLLADVTVATPVVVPAGAKLDLNGKASTGTILGTIAVNGGKYITAEGQTVIGTDARTFESTDAVFTMDAVTGNISLDAGTVTTKDQDGYGNNWTLPGQALTIKSGVTLDVPAGVTMQVNGTTVTIEDGATLDIAGGINLYTANATIEAAEVLTVTTTVAGCEVKYVEGVYTVVESIVIEDVIAATPAAEAIKAAMEAAGVTEIESYTITTKGTPDTGAEADEVAAVLEVFEVTPTVGANGVLSVAYEFGISAMTNVGDTVTITAGVTGAEYRADVEVVFYADGAEIGTATTTADSTEVSITNIDAEKINGKKITVKATK